MQKLRVLDLHGCQKLDDSTLACLALASKQCNNRLHVDTGHSEKFQALEDGNIWKYRVKRQNNFNSSDGGNDIDICDYTLGCANCSYNKSFSAAPTVWNYHPSTTNTIATTSYFSSIVSNNFSCLDETNLSSAVNTDVASMGSLQSLNLSGCRAVTSTGLNLLVKSGFLKGLEEIDLSGCEKLTAACISSLLFECELLRPQNVSYCDNVLDVPGEQLMGGCENLAHPLRYCCRRAN